MSRQLRIGVDVGGTFTDIVATEPSTGQLWHHKERSTPGTPQRAILDGTSAVLDKAAGLPGDVVFFGHGTTVITNMILERKGARLALVTTAGFGDVLDLGRQARPHVYDYRLRRPPALAARCDRFEIAERMDASGVPVAAIDSAALGALADRLSAGGYAAVAICLLHAYRNPDHERQVVAALRARLGDTYISASHAVAPEYREFERFVTTTLNAFVGPRAQRYFTALETGLRDLGIDAPLYTVTSNAGLVDVGTVCRVPVRTALSGPAAGVGGIGRILRRHVAGDLVTFDVGGTSTDIAILSGGQASTARVREVAGYPVLAPMVDIQVIGAGGGSIARLDPGGALSVGPDSAGANPGPAAYGQGGRAATVTDAAVVLGRIGVGQGLGGNMSLDRAAATAAVMRDVGAALGLGANEAAQGILDIATAAIARTIRSAALSRGHEPERLCLVAYGGAGPLLGADVAAALGLRRMVVPEAPGTLCARAILVSDIARDFSVTRLLSLEAGSANDIAAVFEDMAQGGADWLRGESIGASDRRFDRRVECRYVGQNFEIALPYAPDHDTPSTLRAAFDAVHAQTQGFALPDRGVEAVTFRLTARAVQDTAAAEGASPPEAATKAGGASAQQVRSETAPGSRHRQVWFGGAHHETPVHDRAHLAPGQSIDGPAVIEEATATTVVPPDWVARVLTDGILDLTHRAGVAR